MSNTTALTEGPLTLVGVENGITLIPRPTPLTRLNYFDGKFLRADDLSREQDYLRSLVELSNQAGGPGVVQGFDTTLGEQRATIELGPGLAIDPAGRVLYLPVGTSIAVADLLERSRRARADGTGGSATASGRRGQGGRFDACELDEVEPEEPGSAFATDLYVVAIAHVEALCGETDVYGKLCEDACVTSTNRPYRLEGVVVRVRPLSLRPPSCDASWLGEKHLRSRVASAYFAEERGRLGRSISAARLRQPLWCLGARAEPGTDVPLAVLAVNGSSVRFLDAWTARRERMESPARRYWAWQTMMRPWAVFLAQVLQFQCQLRGLLGQPGEAAPSDPCASEHEILRSTRRLLESLEAPASSDRVASHLVEDSGGVNHDFIVRAAELRREVVSLLETRAAPSAQVLIDGGIVELPPAGYLPVVPGAVSVNEQVRRLLGAGVDLRFCVVRPDFVAHALEEAQHLDRICLLQGLEDPTRRERVDILVPDGEISSSVKATGRFFETNIDIQIPQEQDREEVVNEFRRDRPVLEVESQAVRGVTRIEALAAGGGAFHFAGSASSLSPLLTRALADIARERRPTEGDLSRVFEDVVAAPEIISERRFETLGTKLPVESPPGYVWLSARCEENPLALDRGESTRFTAEGACAVFAGGRSIALDATLEGLLYVHDTAAAAGRGRRVRGRITRARVSMTPVLDGAESETQAARVTVDVDLLFRQDGSGRATLGVVFRHAEGVVIRLTSEWGGTPLRAELSVSGKGGNPDEQDEPELDLGTASLRQDDRIGEADHPMHAGAVKTLTLIERGLGEPGFRAGAQSRLFPGQSAAREPTVRATRDWVLFHRRREKQCTLSPPPTRAATRRYRVFHGKAPGESTPAQVRAQIRKILDQPAPDGDARIDEIGVVEFGADGSGLLTTLAEVEAGWSAADPGEVLVYAGGASQGDAASDSFAVMEERLHQVLGLFGALTRVAGDAAVDVLPRVPAFVDVGETDGVILLVTTGRAAATECHRVFTVTDQGAMDFAMELLKSGRFRERFDELASDLGEVEFRAGEATPVSNSLEPVVDAWRQRWQQRAVARAVVISPSADEATVGIRKEQAQGIANAMGGQLTEDHFHTREDLFDGCEAITLLEPAPR